MTAPESIPFQHHCGYEGVRDDLMTWEIHPGEEGYREIKSDNAVFKCPHCFEVVT